MSDIQAIYKSIADMKVGKVKSRNIDKAKLTVRDGDLPLRILIPSTEVDGGFIALGNLQSMVWTIEDLCLIARRTQGKGIEHYSKSMVDYLSLYIAALKENHNPTNTSNVVGLEGSMYPVGWGDKEYWAVDITLTIEEIL